MISRTLAVAGRCSVRLAWMYSALLELHGYPCIDVYFYWQGLQLLTRCTIIIRTSKPQQG